MDKATLVNAVKSLVKVELKNDSGGITPVTAVEQVSNIGKTFSDAMTKNEGRLIAADKGGNKRLKPAREDFGNAFDRGVLKGNRSEVPSFACINFFGKENKVGAVDAFKVSGMHIERIKQGKDIRRGEAQVVLKKEGTKLPGPRLALECMWRRARWISTVVKGMSR